MLDEKAIRQKWREICTRNRPKGCEIDSGAFAIELVRWVESGLTPVAGDGFTAEQIATIRRIARDVSGNSGE